MARALGKSYFNIKPANNVTFFSSYEGQDTIRFVIPAMPGMVLDDMVLSGNMQLNADDTNPYEAADITNVKASSKDFSFDSVVGIHSVLSKVEINSRRQNINLTQTHDYALQAKVKKCQNNSVTDLAVGSNQVMELAGQNANYCMRSLTRGGFGTDGTPFSMKLNCGLFNEADQKIALDKIGGIEIVLYLNTNKNTLFNVQTAGKDADAVLVADSHYTLSNLKLFGRYMSVSPQLEAQYNQVNFKDMLNNLQVLNSSNDVNGFSPQVSQMDNLVIVAQPNSSTKNNFNSNSVSVNEVVGQKQYRVSRDGMSYPVDFPIVNTTALPNITAGEDIGDRTISGNAEATFHNCLAAQNSYPPYHSCINPTNSANANQDIKMSSNVFNANYAPIAVNYQYGFIGYSTPFQNNLLQVQINSSIKTNDNHVDTTQRDQTQTMNNLTKFNASLNYASLMVSR